ncbi:hypothetical protein D3C72_668970 [compost metagenome]
MNKNQARWAMGVAGLLVATTLGCEPEAPKTTESAAPAAAASAAPAEAPAAGAADAKVKTEKVVNPGPDLPKGKVEKSSTAPNGLVKLVFQDEGEKGDWFYRSLYVTSGAHNMDLGHYTEIDKIQWGPESNELTAEVKSPTNSNELTTYELRYKLGSETYTLKELKVETVESAG